MPDENFLPHARGALAGAWFAFALSVAPCAGLAEADSTFSDIHAQIVSPVAVSEIRQMSFARMARPASPGNAAAAPAGNAMGSRMAIAPGDDALPAKIVITGAPNQAVAILVDGTADFGAQPRKIAVSDFTHDGGPSPALGPDGRATIELGARLQVSSDLRYGAYRGAFDVIVSNN